MKKRRHFFKKAAAVGLSFLLAFSTLPTMETMKVQADNQDGIEVSTDDSNSEYKPTTIVNGDFSVRPWVKYKMNGVTGTGEGGYVLVDDINGKNHTVLENGGYGGAGNSTKAITGAIYNEMDKGWNTTEIYPQFGDLFEWTDGNGGGTPAGSEWSYNKEIDNKNNYFAELNASTPGILYQDLSTHPGDVIRWKLKHGLRNHGDYLPSDKPQVMSVEIGAPKYKNGKIQYATSDGNTIESNIDSTTRALYKSNGVTSGQDSKGYYGSANQSDLVNLSIAWVDGNSSQNVGWLEASGVYRIPDNQEVTRFAFKSESTEAPNFGNLLDDIEFSTLFGNLKVNLDNDKVIVTGYWGETNESKKLVLDLGDGTDNNKKILIDMSKLETSAGGKNFKITIPISIITQKDSTATSADVYHEDYPSAKITIALHTHVWKAEAVNSSTANSDDKKVRIYCDNPNFLGSSSTTICPCNGSTNAVEVGVSASDDTIAENAASYEYNKAQKISTENNSKITELPYEGLDKHDATKPIKIGSSYKIYKVENGEENTDVTSVAITDPGKYVVKRAVKIGTTSVYAKKYFTIKKAYTPTVDITGWTYGDTANSPTPGGLPTGYPNDTAHLTYTYYTDVSVTDDKKTTTANGAAENGGQPVNAGTYYVKLTTAGVTDKFDSKTSAPKEFTIAKKAITPTVDINDWVYSDGNTNAQSPTCTGGNLGNGAVSYTYFKGSNADEKTNTGDGAASAGGVPSIPGEYCVVISIDATDNYQAYNPDKKARSSGDRFAFKQFTITKANIDPEIVLLGWTYGSTDTHTPIVTAESGKTLGDAAASSYEYTYYTAASLADDKKTTTANGAAENGGQPVNVGSYWVKVEIPSTSKYFSGTANCSFNITQGGYEPNVTINGWTYGDAANSPVKNNVPAEIPDSKISFSYYTDDLCTEKTTEANSGAASDGAVPVNVGTYWVKMNVEAYGNFVSKSAKNTFTILPADYTIRVGMPDWVYRDNDPVSPSVSDIPAEINPDVTINYKYYTDEDCTALTSKTEDGAADDGEQPVEVGTYWVKATVEPYGNYKQVTGKTSFKILKDSIAPVVAIEDWTYGDTANQPVPSGKLGEAKADTYKYTYYTDASLDDSKKTTEATGASADGAQPVLPGNYYVKLTVPATKNYKEGSASDTFTIFKKAIGPKISLDDWVSGKTPSEPVITGTKGDSPAKSYIIEYFTDPECIKKTTEKDGAKGNGKVPTQPGVYYVKLTIPTTAKYLEGTDVATFNILDEGSSTVKVKDWTYGDKPNAPVVEGAPEGVKITYQYKVKGSDDSTYTDKVPTDAGEYTVKANIPGKGVVQPQNPTGSFIIEKAPLLITIDNKTMFETHPIPNLTYVVTGLVNGDKEDIIKGKLKTTSNGQVGKHVIENDNITVSDNYDVTFENGILTIDKLPQAATVVTPPAEKLIAKVESNSDLNIGATIKNKIAKLDEITDDTIQKVLTFDDNTKKPTKAQVNKNATGIHEIDQSVKNDLSDTITIDISGTKKTVDGAEISMDSIKRLQKTIKNPENNVQTVKFVVSGAEIRIDEKTVDILASQATDGIRLVVQDKPYDKLNDKQEEAVKGHEKVKLFEVFFEKLNGERIHDFGNGEAEIRLAFIPDKKYDRNHLFMNYVAEDGHLEEYVTWLYENEIYYISTHFSDFIVTYDPTRKNATEDYEKYMKNLAKKKAPYMQMTKEIKVGRSFRVDITNLAEDAVIKYTSSKPSIASVSSKGVIKGLKAGNSKITCTVKQNGQTYKVVIIAAVRNGNLYQYSLSKSKLQTPDTDNPMLNIYKLIGIDKPFKIKLKNIDPETVVTYTSEKEAVATVSKKGVITGHKKGYTSVRVHFEQDGQIYDYRLFVRVTNGTVDKEMQEHLDK